MKAKIVYIINFVCAGLGQSILILLPFIAIDLGMNYEQSGFIKSIFNLVNFLFAYVVVKVADYLPNRRLLFTTLVGIPISFALLGFSYSFLILIIYRIIWSILLTFQSVLTKAEISKLAISTNKKGALVSNTATANEIGKLVVSTIIGYVIIWVGWRSASWIIGGAMLLIVFILIFSARSIPYQESDVTRKSINLKAIFKNKKLLISYVCIFIDGFASGSIPLFIPFLIVFYKYSPEALPNLTFIMLIGAIAGRYFLGRVADRTSIGKTFAGAELIMGLMSLFLGLSNNIIIFALASFVIGVFIKGTTPVTQLMLLESAENPANMKNEYAFDSMLGNFGGFLSAIFFGMIGDRFGVQMVFVGFAITSLIAAFMGLVFNGYKANNSN